MTVITARRSQLEALTGRNLKEAWVRVWRDESAGGDLESRQLTALRSPLLQRACDAYLAAFKDDMLTNNDSLEGDIGGINHVCKLAMMQGVKVSMLEVPS